MSRETDLHTDPLVDQDPSAGIRACPPRPRAILFEPQRQLSWRRSESAWLTRFTWAWVLAGCVLMLTAGYRVTPDARGHSTHEQLGLAPCGFYFTTGYPCPTCGATTAFAWMVHGHPVAAVATHPFGAIMAIATVALLVTSVAGIVTAGVPAIRLSRPLAVGLALGLIVLFLGSWLYKIVVMTSAAG